MSWAKKLSLPANFSAQDNFYLRQIFQRQKTQKWNICLRQKPRLIADFTLDHTGGWGGGGIKHNDNDWKFQSYKGTKLCYDMMCESVNSGRRTKR